MKTKKIIFSALLAASVVSLASCVDDKPTPTPTPSESVEPQVDVTELLASYDTTLSTTVKLTYNSNYNVDVDANGGTGNMDSFKHQIRATSVVEMDLGSDLYIKVTKTKKDLLVDAENAVVTEEILYKDGDKYYYDTSSSASKAEVAAADAKAKVADILKTLTYEQAGGITVDSLLYNSDDKSYELANFGLSDTFIEDDLVDPVYSVENDCLTVTYRPEYVGYQTDGGISDFSNEDDGYAAVCTIVTNNKGQVTSWKEEYNDASLDFAIMTIPPTVTITGQRDFTAEYGAALSKSTTVEKAASVVNYPSTVEGGTIEVKEFALPQTFTDLANGGTVNASNFIAIKPTPDSGKEVDVVSVNGNDKPVTVANGWYCFSPVPGTNEISVSFKTAGVVTTATYASAVAGGTFEVKAFTPPQTFADLSSGGELATGQFIAVMPTASEGYSLKSVSVNGSTTTALPPTAASGWYCFSPAQGNNQVLVEFEKTTPAGNYVVYDQVEGGTISVSAFTTNGFVFTPMADGDTLPEGQYVAVKPVALEGYTLVSVAVNGVTETVLPPAQAGGWYCFTAATGANNVVVTFAPAQ